MESILKTVNLSHRYTTAWAIRDINIDITRKGIFGLLGSNGAGKSTTMNIICGALNQTEGQVFINGIDTREQPMAAKAMIGFLPQHPPLYLDLTVEEYLQYAAQLRRMDPSGIAAAMDQVMSRCGITHMRKRLLKNLSGGYRQRVGLAQSIIHQPKLVILDEPTNGLDPVQIIEVRKLIKEIAEERTVILSSHILAEVQLLCRDIYMIEQGQLVFADTMEAFNSQVTPQSLQAVFLSPPVTDDLSRINGVNRVEKLTDTSFRIFHDGTYGVNEAIVTESVTRGWRLTELAAEKSSVEEIFRQLTKQTK